MTILFCTTEGFLLTSLEYRFRKNGWELAVAYGKKEALEKAKELNPELVIINLELPEYEGLDIVQRLAKEVCPDVPLLVGAPLGESDLMMEGLRLGAKDFIIAPFKPDELVLRIRHQLKLAKVAG